MNPSDCCSSGGHLEHRSPKQTGRWPSLRGSSYTEVQPAGYRRGPHRHSLPHLLVAPWAQLPSQAPHGEGWLASSASPSPSQPQPLTEPNPLNTANNNSDRHWVYGILPCARWLDGAPCIPALVSPQPQQVGFPPPQKSREHSRSRGEVGGPDSGGPLDLSVPCSLWEHPLPGV